MKPPRMAPKVPEDGNKGGEGSGFRVGGFYRDNGKTNGSYYLGLRVYRSRA